MFDPFTEKSIQAAPKLPEFDMDELPKVLADAHVRIASLRISLLDKDATPGDDILRKLNELHQLAFYYQSFVAIISDHDSRRSAAYVSASAHELLFRAKSILGGKVQELTLNDDHIGSDLAAILLYLIGGYPTNAQEIANSINITGLHGPRQKFTKAVLSIANGALTEIPATQTDLVFSEYESSTAYASDLLWSRLHEGCVLLSRELLGDCDEGLSSNQIFGQVVNLCATKANENLNKRIEFDATFATYPGQHQAATLLSYLGRELMRYAIVRTSTPIDVDSSQWKDALHSIARRRPYLWSNHIEALDKGFLNPGTSSVLAFPTGAGKSTLAELKCLTARIAGRKVLYLAPTHALVNQVTKDLRSVFPGESVENSLISESFYSEVESTTLPDISVMTPERCLALLGLHAEAFDELGLVVFDECHLLHPKEKGNDRRSLDAMLCILGLMTSAPSSDIVLLSAMVSNGAELADWVAELTDRECISLDLDWKPTRQAKGCIVYQNSDIQILKDKLQKSAQATKTKGPPAALKRELGIKPYSLFCLRQTWSREKVEDYSLVPISTKDVNLSAAGKRARWYLTANKNQVAARIAAESARSGLKVLIFVQTRRDTHSVANTIAQHLDGVSVPVSPTAEEESLRALASSEMGGIDYVHAPINGVATSHNSLLLPCERELNELAFRTDGRVWCLACTATLAQGMNLPADLVILAGDNRYNHEMGAREKLNAHDLLNAAGRAGRAGKRSSGLVLMIPDSVITIDTDKNMLGNGWFELQESVFGHGDRCLHIDDPIESIIDIIETTPIKDLPVDVLYLFDRLPLGTGAEGEERSKSILQKSLAAYHAKKSDAEEDFQERITKTITYAKAFRGISDEAEWEFEMAAASGVDVRIIKDLAVSLEAILDEPYESVEKWLDWWFGWLSEDSGRGELLIRTTSKRRISILDQLNLGGVDLFGSRLKQALLLWMKGAPLCELENSIFATPMNRLGKCDKARSFVGQVVPEVAYAAGHVAQVYRYLLSRIDSESMMPLSLGSLSSCIREGFNSPEALAVHWWHDKETSRPQSHAKYSEVKDAVGSGDPFESFQDARLRIKQVLDAQL